MGYNVVLIAGPMVSSRWFVTRGKANRAAARTRRSLESASRECARAGLGTVPGWSVGVVPA